jgi:hypothetical protein
MDSPRLSEWQAASSCDLVVPVAAGFWRRFDLTGARGLAVVVFMLVVVSFAC